MKVEIRDCAAHDPWLWEDMAEGLPFLQKDSGPRAIRGASNPSPEIAKKGVLSHPYRNFEEMKVRYRSFACDNRRTAKIAVLKGTLEKPRI